MTPSSSSSSSTHTQPAVLPSNRCPSAPATSDGGSSASSKLSWPTPSALCARNTPTNSAGKQPQTASHPLPIYRTTYHPISLTLSSFSPVKPLHHTGDIASSSICSFPPPCTTKPLFPPPSYDGGANLCQPRLLHPFNPVQPGLSVA
ncbi:hypothetical protein PtA15_3A891 [Puccinia triticina]|uniref:Uncharacterized protein n=1 Tax=Puccinia triticina TaxID=208348 RepID=A0ABY7CFH9_9BASI|nr:uncharacterized protein PtA15_3A891 [Puccinia triticina]WAQ83520.1 hypothetical protein PtA15_3A891 [Puccinia triticina]